MNERKEVIESLFHMASNIFGRSGVRIAAQVQVELSEIEGSRAGLLDPESRMSYPYQKTLDACRQGRKLELMSKDGRKIDAEYHGTRSGA